MLWDFKTKYVKKKTPYLNPQTKKYKEFLFYSSLIYTFDFLVREAVNLFKQSSTVHPYNVTTLKGQGFIFSTLSFTIPKRPDCEIVCCHLS